MAVEKQVLVSMTKQVFSALGEGDDGRIVLIKSDSYN